MGLARYHRGIQGRLPADHTVGAQLQGRVVVEDQRARELPDQDLLQRFIDRHDEAAFLALLRRHGPMVLSVCRAMLPNEADAEEIVQEAMLRVWINAARWRPTAAFRTWLYRVVLNLCLNRKRRAPFAALADIVEPADPGPGPELALEMRETDRLLAAAIAALPARQSAAIVLTYQEAMSNAEAAAVLGTSVSGIETLLVRAKRALRKALGPSGQQ